MLKPLRRSKITDNSNLPGFARVTTITMHKLGLSSSHFKITMPGNVPSIGGEDLFSRRHENCGEDGQEYRILAGWEICSQSIVDETYPSLIRLRLITQQDGLPRYYPRLSPRKNTLHVSTSHSARTRRRRIDRRRRARPRPVHATRHRLLRDRRSHPQR